MPHFNSRSKIFFLFRIVILPISRRFIILSRNNGYWLYFVYIDSFLFSDRPQIQAELRNHKVHKGEKARFECSSKGCKPMEFAWFKNNDFVDEQILNSKGDIKYCILNYMLKYTNRGLTFKHYKSAYFTMTWNHIGIVANNYYLSQMPIGRGLITYYLYKLKMID